MMLLGPQNEEADAGRISAFGLYRWGRSYFSAAEVLLSSGQDEVLYPRLFMYCHAFELGLKAYIFQHTGKLCIGHDLIKLTKRAKRYGFSPTDVFMSIVRTFSRHAEDGHRLRYFKQGPVSFPNGEILQREAVCFFDFLTKEVDGAELFLRKNEVRERYAAN